MCNAEVKVEELVNIQTGRKIDMEKFNSLKDNSLLKVKPESWCIWDFEKNDKLGHDIYKMTKGSAKVAWWYCEKCKESHDNAIHRKTHGRGCPYCAGIRVGKSNCLAVVNPKVASEWHPTKNDKTPYDFTSGSGEVVWWQCAVYREHEWKTSINNRNQGTECPFCNENNASLLVGFNDLWTTHPHIANLLVNKEDGYKYSSGSGNKKVKWKCECCDHINMSTIIDLCVHVNCKKCKDSLSLGEKIVYTLLNKLDIDFQHEYCDKWTNNRRYDFFIPSLKTIIEIHGEQHYIQTNRKGGRSLKEEQDNDKYKLELAMNNDVEHYIVIDARHSDFDFIKENILKSELVNIMNISHIDFNNLVIKANLITVKSWELWNKGLGTMEISRDLKISKNAVRRYLKLGNALNKCNYKVEDRYERIKKAVVELDCEGVCISKYDSLIDAKNGNPTKSLQLTEYPFNIIRKTDGNIWLYEEDYLKYKNNILEKIKEWNDNNRIFQLDQKFNVVGIYRDTIDASEKTGFNYTNIRSVLSGRSYTYKGYIWLSNDEYNKILNGELNKESVNKQKKYKKKKIVKLSLNNDFICIYDSISDASRDMTGKNTSQITKCLAGYRNKAYNFRWMYLDDYNQMISEQNNKLL